LAVSEIVAIKSGCGRQEPELHWPTAVKAACARRDARGIMRSPDLIDELMLPKAFTLD